MHIHIGSVLLAAWLIIGGIAAGQRGEYRAFFITCSDAATIAVTIVSGPLNYIGVDPQISCTAPEPSS